MAVYFDGQTAKKHQVQINFDGNIVCIVFPDSIREVSIEDIIIKPISKTELHLILNPITGEHVVVTDPDELSIFDNHKAAKFEFAAKYKVVSYLLVVVAIVGAAWLLAEPISYFVAKLIPYKYERAIAPKVYSYIQDRVCNEPIAEEALTTIFERLSQNYKIDMALDFYILKDPVPNAYAIPGGIIVVHTGLLKIMKSPEQLSAVLAHEISHHLHRDILASLVRVSFLTMAWNAIIGDFTSVLIMDPSTLYQVAQLKFSRRLEDSADREAVKILEAANISPYEMKSFFVELHKMEKELKIDKIPEFLRSHPGKDRMSWLRVEAGKTYKNNALEAVKWNELQAVCR